MSVAEDCKPAATSIASFFFSQLRFCQKPSPMKLSRDRVVTVTVLHAASSSPLSPGRRSSAMFRSYHLFTLPPEMSFRIPRLHFIIYFHFPQSLLTIMKSKESDG
ncbi:hypothetical protein PIB30_058704 [Stylosanthes scabra]|uniref:Uncharacterized protein n=1 Tax=Stylosanthes scabra TaxID=79078 RepID=A0ABU6ZIQ8_9FABA|nr:hypothetical protein [Stylosanthes scabra]